MVVQAKSEKNLIDEISVGDVITPMKNTGSVVSSFIADITLFNLVQPLMCKVGKPHIMHIGKTKRYVKIHKMWEYDN